MYLRNITVSIITTVVLSGCNDDIFVEETTPSAFSVELEGDGGLASVRFQPKGLQTMGISLLSGTPTVAYYGKDGNQLPRESPASEIRRITCTTRWSAMDITIDGDRLLFRSVENASGQGIDVLLTLDYGYASEEIAIREAPGEPVQIGPVTYDASMMRVSDGGVLRRTESFTNNSPIYQTLLLRPYYVVPCNFRLVPDVKWATNIEVQAVLPTLSDGVWQIPDAPTRPILLNVREEFTPSWLDTGLELPFDTPPHTTLRVGYSVNYSTVNVPFSVTFTLPVSGTEYVVGGTCTLLAPVSYEITSTDVS